MMEYKNKYSILALSLSTLCVLGCGGSDSKGESPTQLQHTVQTYGTNQIAKFDEPWAFAELNDGRLLITEKKGKLKIFNPDTRGIVEVNGIPIVAYGGQGGLGDVQLHPNFSHNSLLYLSYAEADPNNESLFGAVVIRGQLDLSSAVPTLKNIQRIWTQVPKVRGQQHYGHRIVFDSYGKLWISSGERANFDPAQDLNTNLGKIIHLNDDGSLIADNPFQTQGEIAKQIWSLGHRNPLGIAFDHRKQLWVAEMGPRGGDELNLIFRGENYGYPIVSEGDHYYGQRIPRHFTRPEFRAPLLAWTPVISPSSLIFYRGSQFPKWKNKAILSGLNSKAIIIVDTESRPVKEIQRLAMRQRIRAVLESKDGSLWVLEDGNDVNLLKLTAQ